MKKEYILFIDSGIGGLSTLAKTISMFSYDFIYYADNKHCPYGCRSKREILAILSKIITKLSQKYRIKVVVLACNTATASAIDQLRIRFKNLVFVGAEPAVNYAHKIGFYRILSLTTPLTKSLERYQKLCQNTNSKTLTLSILTLVQDIENFYFFPTQQNKFKILKHIANICMQSKDFDCIVLGCTHYVFLKPFFRQVSKKILVDGNEGIAKNLLSILSSYHHLKADKFRVKFLLSDQNKLLAKKYKKILSQTLANSNILC